jgi:hypothetical protein
VPVVFSTCDRLLTPVAIPMRPIPKSKLLTALELTLLAAVVGTCVTLWKGKNRFLGSPPADDTKSFHPTAPRAVPLLAASSRPRTPDAGVHKVSLRQNRPFYARTFDALYDNPQLNPLHLTNDQVDQLVDCCARFYLDRLTLEASLAQVDQVDGGGVLIEIPAYPDAGKALEQALLSSLKDKFGAQLEGQIEFQYLQEIESQNQYLGQFPQRILASVDSENIGRVKVVHDISDPNGVFRSTKIGQLTESDFGEYGPLASYFPKP